METTTRRFPAWTKFDTGLVWLVCAVGLLTGAGFLLALKYLIACEDATILFLFSRNLAETGAITYTAGGVHAEGATDFLWMVYIALGIKLHIAPFVLVQLTNLASLIGIAAVLARLARVRLRWPWVLFVMGCYGFMPQYIASLLGFSVAPFCLLLALLVLFFSQGKSAATALTALALCLFRPDGVVFAVPLLIAGLIIDPASRKKRFGIDVALFVLPGLAYFFWRWHYFGSFMPLPFLVKSNTVRVLHLFVPESVIRSTFLSLFVYLLCWLALRRQGSISNAVKATVVCVLVLPTFFYCAMRLEQDFGLRFFQYLPLGLAVVLAMMWDRIGARRALLLRVAVLAWCVLLANTWYTAASLSKYTQFNARKSLAQDLGALPNGTMVITEAGVLPYYSGWKAYDAWGLNTAEFAKRLFQPSDVERLRPDLMLVFTLAGHECTVAADYRGPYQDRNWRGLTQNMIAGAQPNYDLYYIPLYSAAFRAGLHQQKWDGQQECWFVRRNSPIAAGIRNVLLRHDAETPQEFESHQTATPSLATATGEDASAPVRRSFFGRLRGFVMRWWTAFSS